MNTEIIGHGSEKTRQALTKLANDIVVRMLAVGLALLALVDWNQFGPTLVFTGEALLQMLPFLLLAAMLTGYAKASGADKLISRAFTGNPVNSVVFAALVGAFSPFCSCGVIPLIGAMLGAGVPLAPVMAFWIASPIMDPEMFVLTAAGIGLNFAIAKTIATVFMGLVAGFSVLAMERMGFFTQILSTNKRSGCAATLSANAPVNWRFWQDGDRLVVFMDEVRSVGWFLFKWLTFAFFLESLMIAYIPSAWVASAVGGGQWYAIPLASFIGIPSYLNGYAAIPLVAGLLDMGMSAGAAMAFITSGAVSSIPAAIAVYALVRKNVFAVYVALGLSTSMVAGLIYQLAGGPI